jgi:plastocyanin domain-containing protein
MLSSLLVTLAGIGLIVWVNWYFLFSEKTGKSDKKRRKMG